MIAVPPKPVPVRDRYFMFLAIAAILIAAASVYAPRLNDFFLSDDFVYLHACRDSPAFGADDRWYSVMIGQADFLFRPFLGLTGWLIYAGAGSSPFWWHLVNLALHLLSTWLTILLLRRFVASRWAAIAAGAIFALHFINAETVTWISARTSLLVTALVLAAIVLETAPRRRLWGLNRWGALGLALLAHLSKEHAVVLPVLLLLAPPHPIDLDAPPMPARGGRLRAMGVLLYRRMVDFWPFIIMTSIFILFRFGAIVASTQAANYRLELNANVIKNLVFLCVSTLYPLDFRAALGAWNAWYLQGDFGALTEFILGSPGALVGTFVAAGLWCAILLWGHRAAKRLAVWVFIAALPVVFFRGAGERLIYPSLPGMAGAIAVILAVWHRSFVASFQRVGRWISPVLVLIILLFNLDWLHDKLRDWQAAGELSRTIVSALASTGERIPSGATVRFTGLPDNINGAWVFRSGIDDAFALYANRPDVHALPTRTESPSPADAGVLDYVWNGQEFSLTTAAMPGAHTDPQSTEP